MFGYFRSILDRDPAARWWELPLYPSLYAVFCHRVAHFLWVLRVPLLPRLISALSALFTGIEIHPGARIGRNFFVDHGQGTVIGETAEIGEHSKVGANAVVVTDVPAHSTVVGVPGRVVTLRGKRMEGHELDHQSLPDPLLRRLEHLERDLARHAGSYAPRAKKKK